MMCVKYDTLPQTYPSHNPNISFVFVYWKMIVKHNRLFNLSLSFGHYSKQALLPTRHVLPIVSLLFVLAHS